MKPFFFILIMTLFISCSTQQVDLIIHNAKIYTVDANFSVTEAIAVKDGKIVATGSDKEILQKYSATQTIDAEQKFVYPGFIDAHAHFYGLGKMMQVVDLKNTGSWDQIVEILQKAASEMPDGWLLGRGWDQHDWEIKDFPTKEKLDELFPNRPVYLTRIDGHAAIVNQTALTIAGFDEKSEINGGEFVKKNGKLTGVLIDNAKDKMYSLIPESSEKQTIKILHDAQQSCFENGLTSVIDAGLDYEMVELIEKLHQNGELKIRLNIMLSDHQKNLDYLLKRGKIKTDRLTVNGFKFYGDGALGSRGACLLEDYSDQKGHKGFLLSDISHFEEMAKIMYQNNFQMFTHAIGDSTNRALLKVYADVLKGKNDRRWRIEHAQVVNPHDFDYFGKFGIIPSVQPTHATSDMYWAGERLGNDRLKSAYAYQDLLQQNGWLPLGTDFPIEEVSPILTFYAAVARKDSKGYPEGGFQPENALTREQALKGITIWAAKGSFEETKKGSLEPGKVADFILLDQDLMQAGEPEILNTQVLATYVAGEKVYQK